MADPRRAPLKDQTDIAGARALIVEARFYDDIQDALMEGAVAELKAAGVTHDVNTIHFEIVSIESSRALMDLAVARGFPLGNGIITVNTEAQAWARARASELNKGGDAARAALAMLRIKRRLTKA